MKTGSNQQQNLKYHTKNVIEYGQTVTPKSGPGVKDQIIKTIGGLCASSNSVADLPPGQKKAINDHLNELQKHGGGLALFQPRSTASIIYASVLIYAKLNDNTLPDSLDILKNYMLQNFTIALDQDDGQLFHLSLKDSKTYFNQIMDYLKHQDDKPKGSKPTGVVTTLSVQEHRFDQLKAAFSLNIKSQEQVKCDTAVKQKTAALAELNEKRAALFSVAGAEINFPWVEELDKYLKSLDSINCELDEVLDSSVNDKNSPFAKCNGRQIKACWPELYYPTEKLTTKIYLLAEISCFVQRHKPDRHWQSGTYKSQVIKLIQDEINKCTDDEKKFITMAGTLIGISMKNLINCNLYFHDRQRLGEIRRSVY